MSSLTAEQLQMLQALHLATEEVAQESFLNINVPGFFKNFLTQVQQILQFSGDSLKLAPIKGIKTDQRKFLQLTHSVPYTSTIMLAAYRPEGMIKTYLEFLAVLKPVTEHIKTVQKDVVQPYAQFLSHFVSDRQFALSARDERQDLDHREKVVKDIYTKFSHLYGKDHYGGKCQLKDVIHRAQDWTPVLQQLNECVANVEAVDRQQLEQIVTECNGYIGLIVENYKAEPDRKVSQEAAARLSAHAYCVAREIELFATTYYRVLALSGTINQTIENFEDSMS